jgi:DNA-binding XRE family transcriptional regulator
MKIVSRLKVIFAERNIRQKPFAEKLDISQTTLSYLVNNRTLPTLEMAYRIADELQMQVEQIWVRVEE